MIDMYYLPFPVWLHWIIYAFEFLAFIALVYGLFKEKTELILPFIIIEVDIEMCRIKRNVYLKSISAKMAAKSF